MGFFSMWPVMTSRHKLNEKVTGTEPQIRGMDDSSIPVKPDPCSGSRTQERVPWVCLSRGPLVVQQALVCPRVPVDTKLF